MVSWEFKIAKMILASFLLDCRIVVLVSNYGSIFCTVVKKVLLGMCM